MKNRCLVSPGVGILNRISCCCLFFLLAATDELLHLQSRQDRADPALRDEPTKLPLVLQVCNKQEFSLSYRISLICSSSMNSAHSYITNMFLFLPQLRCCQQTYWWQAIPSCSQQGSAEINPLIPCTWSCTPANQAHKIAGFVVHSGEAGACRTGDGNQASPVWEMDKGNWWNQHHCQCSLSIHCQPTCCPVVQL